MIDKILLDVVACSEAFDDLPDASRCHWVRPALEALRSWSPAI